MQEPSVCVSIPCLSVCRTRASLCCQREAAWCAALCACSMQVANETMPRQTTEGETVRGGRMSTPGPAKCRRAAAQE